jgi:mRNA interferase MazF
VKDPLRAEIWMADLDPSRGHEQAGKRPVLVVSADAFNAGPAGLVVVVPITSKAKGIRSHIAVEPGSTALRTKSYVLSEQPRTISKERLSKQLGSVSAAVMVEVELWLRVLLEL